MEGVEIIEAPDWCGLSAGMKLDCPHVVRCHGSDTFFGHLLGYRPRFPVRIAESMAIRDAKGLSAVTQFVAKITSDLFRPREPVEVIPNGIDLCRFTANITDLRPIQGRILFVGTLGRKKGIL